MSASAILERQISSVASASAWPELDPTDCAIRDAATWPQDNAVKYLIHAYLSCGQALDDLFHIDGWPGREARERMIDFRRSLIEDLEAIRDEYMDQGKRDVSAADDDNEADQIDWHNEEIERATPTVTAAIHAVQTNLVGSIDSKGN